MNPLLDIEDLRVTAPDGTGILHGVDLRIGRGEVLGLVGESGCGKSLTAASVLGLLPAGLRRSGGVVRLDGRDLGALDEAALNRLRGARMALVPQDAVASLNPTRTIGWHLVEGLCRHRGLGRRDARRAAADLLARVGLTPQDRCVSAYPHQLSGGMNQRVAIARALCGAPDLLIADEPTTALDVTTQAQILGLLSDLVRQSGLSLLFVTHDLGVVAQIADRVAVMYCGRVVETGTVDAFFSAPRHPYSAGLRGSIPPLDRSAPVVPLPGSVPPPGALPTGCAFHPRCGIALPICRDRRPTLAPLALGAVACHVAQGAT